MKFKTNKKVINVNDGELEWECRYCGHIFAEADINKLEEEIDEHLRSHDDKKKFDVIPRNVRKQIIDLKLMEKLLNVVVDEIKPNNGE